MKKSALVLLAMVMLFLGVPKQLNADTTWDVTSSFRSDNGNPNGVWSYGWRNYSQFQLYTSNGPDINGLPVWWGPLQYDGGVAPVIALNTTGSPINGVQPGQLALHPGPNGEASVLRWTAPVGVSGLGSIQGQFLPGDAGIMQVGVFENGNWASPLWTGTDSGAFSISVPLTAGDTIDFAVYGGFGHGSTPLQATITAAPEPSTFVLLGFGAVGLLGFAWRRRKTA
jgi:hypothetical protein